MHSTLILKNTCQDTCKQTCPSAPWRHAHLRAAGWVASLCRPIMGAWAFFSAHYTGSCRNGTCLSAWGHIGICEHWQAQAKCPTGRGERRIGAVCATIQLDDQRERMSRDKPPCLGQTGDPVKYIGLTGSSDMRRTLEVRRTCEARKERVGADRLDRLGAIGGSNPPPLTRKTQRAVS